MKKMFILNFIYFMVLNLLFIYIGEMKISVIQTLFIIFITLLYTRILYALSYKLRVGINAVVMFLLFIIVGANCLNIYIKGQVLTASQVKLFEEFMVIKDTMLQYVNVWMLLVLLIPLTFVYLGAKFLKQETRPITKKEFYIGTVSLVAINLVSYINDPLLYATLYNPNAYVEKYGFTSYYAREILPFTKQNLSAEEMGMNKVVQEKYDQSEFYGMFADKKECCICKC